MLRKSSLFALAFLSLSASEIEISKPLPPLSSLGHHGIITLQNVNLIKHGILPIDQANYTIGEPFHIMGGSAATSPANAIDFLIGRTGMTGSTLTFEANSYLDDISTPTNKTILHINPIDPDLFKAPMGTLINHAMGSNGNGSGFGIGTHISCESGTIINEGKGVEFGYGGQIDIIDVETQSQVKFINRNDAHLGNNAKAILIDCWTLPMDDYHLINMANGQIGSPMTIFLVQAGKIHNDGQILAAEVSLLKDSVVTLDNKGLLAINGDWISEAGTGTITNNNIKNITAEIVGAHLIAQKGEIQINGQNFVNFNAGNISTASGEGSGALIHAHDVLHFLDTGTIINHNTGSISQQNYGALIEANTSLNDMNTCTLDIGTMMNLNEGIIVAGTGAALSFPKTLVLSGTTFSNINKSAAIHQGTGALLLVGQDLNLSEKTLSFLNTADATFDPITGTSIGANFIVDGNMTISSTGALSLKNDAALHSTHEQLAIGTGGTILGNLTMSGGSLTLHNTPATLVNSVGVKLDVTGALTMINATATNTNAATSVTSSNSNFGSQFSSASMSLANSTFTNTSAQTIATTGAIMLHQDSILTNHNTLPSVNETTVSESFGSQLLVANGIMIGANGVLTNSNTGNVDAAMGSFIGSDIFVQNNGITMTGGTINSTHNQGNAVSGSAQNAGAAIRTLGIGGLIFSAGTITIENKGDVSEGTGSLFSLAGALALSKPGIPTPILNINNTVEVKSGVGAQLKAQTATIAASGGTLNLSNTSSLSNATGASANFSNTGSSAFTMAGGNVNVINTGDLNQSTGVSLKIAGTLAMTGGTLTNSHTGTSQATSAIPAALVSAETITMAHATLNNTNAQLKAATNSITIGAGALLTNTNNAIVDSTHVSDVYGSQVIAANGLLINSKGTVNNIHTGTVTGSFFGSDISILNGGIMMTGGNLSSLSTGTVRSSSTNAGASIRTWGTGGFALSGGSAIIKNDGSVEAGIGSLLSLGGPLAISGESSLVLSNTSIPTANGIGTLLSASMVTLASGTLNMVNTAELAHAGTSGTQGNIAGNFILIGGALNLSNTSEKAIGTQLNIKGDLIMQGGTIKNTHIPGGGSGSELLAANITMSQNAVSLVNAGGLVNSSKNFTLSTGTYTNTNDQTVAANCGSKTVVGNLLTLNGGIINNINSGSVNTAAGGAYGALFTINALQDTHSLNMNTGTFNIKNSGTINQRNVGSAMIVPENAGPLVFAGGTIHCINAGDIIGGTGSQLDLSNNDMTVAGALNVANSFPLAQTGIGSQLIARHFTLNSGGSLLIHNDPLHMNLATAGARADIAGDFNMNGGTLSVANSANLNQAIGSALYIAGNFTQHTGTVENINAGALQNSGSGSIFSAGSIKMLPGTISFTNKGGLVQTATKFSLEDGTFSNINERPIDHTQVSLIFGSQVEIGTSGALSGGHYINRNTAAVSDSKGGFFGAVTKSGSDITMTSGSTLSIINTGNVTAHNTGSAVISAGNFNMTTGNILKVANEASDISGTGSQLVVEKTLQMTGGTLTNQTIDERFETSLIQAAEISIAGGVFLNNAHVKADRVEVSKGTLTGYGTIDPSSKPLVVSNTHGIVEPGDSTQIVLEDNTSSHSKIMTINGTYLQGSNGTLMINLSPDGVSQIGSLTVTHAQLGGHLILNPLKTLAPHGVKQIEILTITEPTGLIGTFSTVTMGDVPASLSPIIVYGNDIDHAFVKLVFQDPLPPLPPPPVPLVITYLGGKTYQTMFILINRNNFRLEREMQRLRQRFPERETAKKTTSAPEQSKKSAYTPSLARNSITPIASSNLIASSQSMLAFLNFQQQREQQQLHEEMSVKKVPERPWNFFCGPTGGTGKVNTQGKQLGAHYWDLGALAGFDYAFSQVGIGLLVDFDRTHVDVEQNWGHYHFEHLHSSFFATYAPHILPQLAFNSVIGGAYDWYDIHRNTKINGIAKGHTRGSELDALFATEYVFSSEQFSGLPKKLELVPRAFLQYIYIDINKFTERSAGFANVHLHSQFGKSLRSGLDLWAKYTWDWTNFSLAFEANIGWQREYFDHGQSIHFTPISVKGLTTPIASYGAGRDTLTTGLDCFFQFLKKYSLELSYDFQYNRLFYDHAFYLGCEVRY
jgi:hypothetical protein